VYALVKGKRVSLNARIIASKGSGAHSYGFQYRVKRGQKAPTHFVLETVQLDGKRLAKTTRLGS